MTMGIGSIVAFMISGFLIVLASSIVHHYGWIFMFVSVPMVIYAILLMLLNINQGFGSQYTFMIHFPSKEHFIEIYDAITFNFKVNKEVRKNETKDR
jgi:energy-coupling factor transporter transmembrane protein EcfT